MYMYTGLVPILIFQSEVHADYMTPYYIESEATASQVGLTVWCSNLIAGLYLIAFNFRPTFKKIEKEKFNMLLCNSPNYSNCTGNVQISAFI